MQHGFDEDTTMDLCGSCYDMYRQLYITHIEGDDDEEESDPFYNQQVIEGVIEPNEEPCSFGFQAAFDDCEGDGDPLPPDTNMS